MAAASCTQVEAPLAQGRVFTSRSDDMVGAFNQELAEVAIARLCDSELGVAIPGLTSAWSEAEITTNISASLKTLLIAQGEHEGQCCEMSNAIDLDERLRLRIDSPGKFFNRHIVLLDYGHVSNLVEQRAECFSQDRREHGQASFGKTERGRSR
jgi:hypothetical protein